MNCPHCGTEVELPFLKGKEGWCKVCEKHVGKEAESKTREGGASTVNDLLEELGFKDRAEQSIWTKLHAGFFVMTFQFCSAGTEHDVDTWYFTVHFVHSKTQVVDVQSRRFTDCLHIYFLYVQLLEGLDHYDEDEHEDD